MSGIAPDQAGIVKELYSRRDTLDPQKRAIVDELAGRMGLKAAAQPVAQSDYRTATQVMQDQAAHVLTGIPRAITGIPSMLRGIWDVASHPTDAVRAANLVKSAVQPLTTSIQGAGALIAPGSVTAPSREEFEQASEGAGTNLGGLLLGEGIKAAAPLVAPAVKSGIAGAGSTAAAAAEGVASRTGARIMAPVVGANKVRFGNIAADIAPEVLRKTEGLSTPAMRESVAANLDNAKANLDAFHETVSPNKMYPTEGLLEDLQKRRAQLDVKGSANEDITPEARAERAKTLDTAIDEVKRLGDSANFQNLRNLRTAWDGPAKVIYSPAVTPEYFKAQGRALGYADASGTLRDFMAAAEPGSPAVNADYHLWKQASDVMKAAEETERVRPTGLRTAAGRIAGSAIGNAVGGPVGAAIGAVVGPAVDWAASTATTGAKIWVARQLAHLSDTLRSGDAGASDAVLASIHDRLDLEGGPRKAGLPEDFRMGRGVPAVQAPSPEIPHTRVVARPVVPPTSGKVYPMPAIPPKLLTTGQAALPAGQYEAGASDLPPQGQIGGTVGPLKALPPQSQFNQPGAQGQARLPLPRPEVELVPEEPGPIATPGRIGPQLNLPPQRQFNMTDGSAKMMPPNVGKVGGALPTKLSQSIDSRLAQIRDIARSGASETTGNGITEFGPNGERGKTATVGGGFSQLFPELGSLGETPSRIAAAIDKGSGPLFGRIKAAVANVVSDDFERQKEIGLDFGSPERASGIDAVRTLRQQPAVSSSQPSIPAESTLATMDRDWRELKTAGDKMEQDPKTMTKAAVSDYIDKSEKAAVAHFPEAAMPLSAAKEALQKGDIQAAYQEAKRARQGIRTEWNQRHAEQNIPKVGTPQEIARMSKLVAERRAENLKNLGH